MKKKRILPLQPLREMVLFPGLTITINVGRDISVAAIEAARSQFDNHVLVVTQRDGGFEGTPDEKDLYGVGVIGEIRRPPIPKDESNRTYMVTIEGVRRVRIVSGSVEYFADAGFIGAGYSDMPLPVGDAKRCAATASVLKDGLREYAGLVDQEKRGILMDIIGIDDYDTLAYCAASGADMGYVGKQAILEAGSVDEQLAASCEKVIADVEILNLGADLRRKIHDNFERDQKNAYLREKIAEAKRELGESEDTAAMADDFMARGRAVGLPDAAMAHLVKEAGKLSVMSVQSSEFTTLRSYLELFVDLPWATAGKGAAAIRINPDRTRKTMDKGHYGMDVPKTRIVEFLAVKSMSPEHRTPVLCFVGPPGVGKTSMAMSVAEAVGRKACRVALGGVHDEAEIRGHRRTYVGAMPGKIIRAISRCGSGSPVMVLDEIDKMGSDFKGDPSAAMLEVLDPAQNHTFLDHYLDHEFDLSGVMFIATANSTEHIPAALLDRMEIIEISGYLETEKLDIAGKHLVPRAMREHGLSGKNFSIGKAQLKILVRNYTREAGVRSLEQSINSICRKAAVRILGGADMVNVTAPAVRDMLGVPKFDFGRAEETDQVGVTMGLAWTSVGGEVLTVESVVMPGDGKVKATGKLGEVMQESAQASMSFVRSIGPCLGLPDDFHKSVDIHIHVPEGATPKDGPSAGVTITTSLVSSILGVPVRKNVAMTGEITLRGRVLPIGGLREKLLAAQRAGIDTVLIPKANMKDLAEVPKDILEKLRIVPVDDAMGVLREALVNTDMLTNRGRFVATFPKRTDVGQDEKPSA